MVSFVGSRRYKCKERRKERGGTGHTDTQTHTDTHTHTQTCE